jgi:hypothetical protein
VDFLKKSADFFHFFEHRGKKNDERMEVNGVLRLNRVLQIWILVETFSGSHPWREISMTEQENEPTKHMSGRRTKRFDFNSRNIVLLKTCEFATN